MSGNPYGLSGISHYGTMQRVGGKAAGFINKKFFHPSSLRNQEKLWLAQSADEIERKKQDEMDKRREEEMQVEQLRKQMYLAGQATKGSDMLGGSMSSGSAAPQHVTKDQKLAFEEQQRRRAQLKQESAAALIKQEGDDDCELADDSERRQLPEAELLASLAKSGYREDEHVRGHSTVWGSWYAKEEERWGFVCCKSLERNKRCPLAPEEEEQEKPKRTEPRTRGKRRRRGGGAANATDAPANGGELAAPAGATDAALDDGNAAANNGAAAADDGTAAAAVTGDATPAKDAAADTAAAADDATADPMELTAVPP